MSDPVGKRIFFIFSVIFLHVVRGRRFGTFFVDFSIVLGRTFGTVGTRLGRWGSLGRIKDFSLIWGKEKGDKC